MSAPQVELELREPLDSIVEVLHRLSIQRLGHYRTGVLRPAPDSPHLLQHARSLAGQLRATVDALLGPDCDGVPRERRLHAEPISIIAAFEDAAATASPALSGRHVTLSCPTRLTLTTDIGYFHDLLSMLLVEAAREPGEVHAVVQRDDDQLTVCFAGLHIDSSSGRELDKIQSLAACLGGRIDVVSHPDTEAGIRLRLPQQRARDRAPSPAPTQL